MIVKVCGVREPAIAEAAIDAGADWLGLVLEPRSVRYVDDDAARRVVDAVHGRADLIGVFVEPSAAQCDEAAERYRLAGVQVHGNVPLELATLCHVPVIRGYNMPTLADALTLQWWPDCLLLLDSPAVDGGLPGGTGRRIDLDVAAEVASHRRVILAGGLGPDDVADAIQVVRPEGVDASSKLESTPGVKDAHLVRQYVQHARAALDTGDGR
jgi:phosphoribosylanthranilate isomerase